MFGNQHFIALLFFLIFGIALIKWARKFNTNKKFRIAHYFALSLSLTVVVWTFIKIYLNGFDIKQDLPFHLCNIIALVLPIFTITRKKLFFEIIFFWILCGTSHSIITPDLVNGFPNFVFFKYWYVHAGLIIFVFYGVFVLNIKPTIKSIFKSFIALQIYILLMFIVNYYAKSNYFYTNYKPLGGSALDYLGDYPYYIFVVEIIMIPYFFLMYLPFSYLKKKID